MSLSNAAVRDIETVIHPYTNLDTFRDTGPMIIERGEGIYVYDNGGNRYIEGLAGLWCTSLGYNEQELIDAAVEQMKQIPFTHTFGGKSHERAAEAAERLKAIAPHAASQGSLLRLGFGSERPAGEARLVLQQCEGPSEQEEVHLAHARLSRRHRRFRLADRPAPRTTAISTCPSRACSTPIARITTATRSPAKRKTSSRRGSRRTSKTSSSRKDPDTVAAFIAEPIMGAGGVVIPPAGYFEKIQAVLTKYDVYFIADEVICGFGRTGNMFGSETFGMKPDSISVAKALSSAYFPIAAVTVGEDMYQAMIDESKKIGVFGHGFTYTAHPVGAAVAAKTLEIYEKRNIVGHVRGLAPRFEGHVERLAEHPLVGHARARGLIGAIELVADKSDKRQLRSRRPVSAPPSSPPRSATASSSVRWRATSSPSARRSSSRSNRSRRCSPPSTRRWMKWSRWSRRTIFARRER